MSLHSFTRAWWKGKRQADELSDIERDWSLRVFLNDTRCDLVLRDKAGGQVARYERLADSSGETQSLVTAAIQALPPDFEKQIGNVEVFIDDPELSVVDSRQAKLSHFEGRALAEFGKYQLGGKPVCFASHRFGETSASETEKRVVAYIPEDRLTAILFALGKLARFTTFFGPWSLQPLLTGESEETRAQLTVHSRYSTLALTNDSAGAVAVRQLPVGTAGLAEAYAKAHGIDAPDAAAALAARPRLSLGKEWPLPAGAPAAHTGSHMALAPMLEKLTGEIAATSDYFEFQRLAGRAGELRLSQLGARVAGFAGWLSDMLQIGVTDADLSHQEKAPALNLLEGMRTGLLKIGNQHYDFAGGRFVLSANQPSSTANQSVAAKWKSASSQPVTLEMLKPFAIPLGGLGAALAVLAGTYLFLLAPISQDSETATNLYSNTLTRIAQANLHAAKPAAEPVLWARDMMAVGAAMPYDMKLKRMALIQGNATTAPSFELEGALPRAGADNLQLIGRFMKRLSASQGLHRRFAEINFGGAAENDVKSGDNRGAGAPSPADDQAVFKLVAKVTPTGGTP